MHATDAYATDTHPRNAMPTKVINAAEEIVSLAEDYDFYEACQRVAWDNGLEQDEAEAAARIAAEELGL